MWRTSWAMIPASGFPEKRLTTEGFELWLTYSIGKDPDAGRDWGQKEKGTTEDEMAGWHHWLDRRESQWTPGVGDGQGGLACCDSWGRKESDTTERLIWLSTNAYGRNNVGDVHPFRGLFGGWHNWMWVVEEAKSAVNPVKVEQYICMVWNSCLPPLGPQAQSA